jgi:hypothetical protein
MPKGSIKKTSCPAAGGAGGDGVILALEIEHKRGTGVVEQVWDDRADALAGAGRGAGQDVPILPEAPIGIPRCIAQLAQSEGVVRRGRPQMGRGVPRPAEMGGAVGREGRGREQRRPNVTQTAGQEAGTAQEQEANHREPQDQGDPSVRPAGDGVEESQWQPAQRQAHQEEQRELDGTRYAEPHGEWPEPDSDREQRDAADPQKGVGDGGESAAGPRRIAILVRMGGERQVQLARLLLHHGRMARSGGGRDGSGGIRMRPAVLDRPGGFESGRVRRPHGGICLTLNVALELGRQLALHGPLRRTSIARSASAARSSRPPCGTPPGSTTRAFAPPSPAAILPSAI